MPMMTSWFIGVFRIKPMVITVIAALLRTPVMAMG